MTSIKNITGVIARSTNDKYGNGYTFASLTINLLDGSKQVYKEKIVYGDIEEPQRRFKDFVNQTFGTSYNYFREIRLNYANDIDIKHVSYLELTRLYKAYNNIFHLESIILWNKTAKVLTKAQNAICKAKDVEVINNPSSGWCVKSLNLNDSFNIEVDYSKQNQLLDKQGVELQFYYKVV